MAERTPSAMCIEGKGWEPCRGCGEQPEIAQAPFGGRMVRCFTEGCVHQGKGEGGWQLAAEWQSNNKARTIGVVDRIEKKANQYQERRACMAMESLTAETIAQLVELTAQIPEGPYFADFDDGGDCPNHANSGLAVVDTGRESDWPIARHCHWPVAKWIVLVRVAMPALIEMLAEKDADLQSARAIYERDTQEMASLRAELQQKEAEVADWTQRTVAALKVAEEKTAELQQANERIAELEQGVIEMHAAAAAIEREFELLEQPNE